MKQWCLSVFCGAAHKEVLVSEHHPEAHVRAGEEDAGQAEPTQSQPGGHDDEPGNKPLN